MIDALRVRIKDESTMNECISTLGGGKKKKENRLILCFGFYVHVWGRNKFLRQIKGRFKDFLLIISTDEVLHEGCVSREARSKIPIFFKAKPQSNKRERERKVKNIQVEFENEKLGSREI